MLKFKNSIINNKKYILVFISLFLLCSLFPYSGDDWDWGSPIGVERLNNFFQNYNGRYAGNLIVLILTRALIIRNITMASILFGIIYLCEKIVKKGDTILFLIATALLLAIPRLVFRQAIVWTAGFTNYAISIFLVLVYVYLIKDLFKYKLEDNSKTKIFFTFLLAFTTGLFIENITIYIILLAILVIVYSYINYKDVPKFSISYLLGSVASTVVMFSNGAYHNILNDGDSYRQVPTGGLVELIEKVKDNYLKTIYNNLILNNVILNVVVALLLFFLVYRITTKKNINKKINIIISCSLYVVILYNLYILFKTINPTWKILLKYTNLFEGLISALYLCAIIFITFFCIEKTNIKHKLLFYLLSIILLTVPLFIVTPIGSRCFLATYIFFILYILELYNYLFENKLNISKTKYINNTLIICILFLGTYLVSVYVYITKVNTERINYIKQEELKGSKQIEIPRLPYENHVWMSSPDHSPLWEKRFKLFYNINEDIEIITIPLKSWNKKYDN